MLTEKEIGIVKTVLEKKCKPRYGVRWVKNMVNASGGQVLEKDIIELVSVLEIESNSRGTYDPNDWLRAMHDVDYSSIVSKI